MYRYNLFYLNFTSKTQKSTNSLLSRPLLTITDLKKFGMPNFGHSKYLPIFLHFKGLNKFRMPIFGHSKFLPVFLYQKGFNKFGMCIFGHSKFIPVFLGKIVQKNLEQPFLAIPNLYQSFWAKL